MADTGKIRITLKRSPISQIKKHRDTLEALGLRRPNRSVVKPDTPVVRGMVNSVAFMVEVEPATD
jgi:large subunit ribosomal protein L30